MNTNVKVGLKGKYIFKDSNGNVIRVVDNLITDWGFKRFCGATNHFCYNFWMNMRYLFLGEQTATELPVDYELASYHVPNDPYSEGSHFPPPPRPFANTPTFFIKHLSIDPNVSGGVTPWHSEPYNAANWDDNLWNNSATGLYYWPPRMVSEGGNYNSISSPAGSKFPNLVGTTYLRDPISGDLILRFANTWNIKFNAATTIGEIGVGPVPLNSNDDPIVRCGGTQPYSSGSIGSKYEPSAGPVDQNRIGHLNNSKTSLFSRATLNPQAFFNATDETTVTYVCDIVVCQELAMSLNLPFELASGSLPSDAFPSNKTGMRQIPFFKLQGNAKTDNFDRKWIVKSSPAYRSIYDTLEGVGIPLFDNMHSTPTGIWVLDTFKYTIPVFNTIQPTLSTDHQEYNVSGIGAKAVPNPVNTTYEKHYNPTQPNNTASYVKRYYPVGGVVTSPVVGSGLPGSENTYVTKIDFVIPSNHWIVGGSGGGEEMNSFTLWRPINRNHFVTNPLRVQTGFHTFLNGLYTPSPNKFIKISYQITWNRL